MERAAVGPAFAEALRRERTRYNARLAEASASGGFDAGLFLDSLRTHVAPLVEAAAVIDPACAPALTDSLFDLALGAARASGGVFAPSGDWTMLMEGLSARVAEAPSRVPAALYNGLSVLSQTPHVRVGEWVAAFLKVGRLCRDASSCLAAGQSLAWLCGMAHYREGALGILATLPPQAAAAALGLRDPKSVTEALTRLAADPWARPDGGVGELPRLMHRVGGFRGFGGPFLAPPVVRNEEGVLYASDGLRWWRLYADNFGAVLLIDEGPGGGGSKMGALSTAYQRLPGLADCHSWAIAGGTLAAATPHSHTLSVVAC